MSLSLQEQLKALEKPDEYEPRPRELWRPPQLSPRVRRCLAMPAFAEMYKRARTQKEKQGVLRSSEIYVRVSRWRLNEVRILLV